MTLSTFNFPTAIVYGPGARQQVPSRLAALGVRRPLLVTDRGVAALDIFADVKGMLEAAGLAVASFSEIWGNPVESQVIEGVAAYKAHDADGIVALGGGAAIDVAKVIGLMATHPGDLFDYEDGKPDALPVNNALPPCIAIATTAGTGSEVGRSSVVSDDVSKIKKIIFDPQMLPRVAVLDAELTVGLPAGITAATGIDALTHNVEAYLAKGFHPICDGIALEGIRLVSRNLEKAVRTPGDLEARGQMLLASTMGATAFQKGLGVNHSCAHALSTVVDMHHGLANALMLPACMAFNAVAVPDRFAEMAHAAGCVERNADAFIAWLKYLNRAVGIPSSLGECGVKASDIDRLVEVAIHDVCHPSNPRPVTVADLRALFEAAL